VLMEGDEVTNGEAWNRFQSSIVIARPSEDVWRFLSDVSNDTRWRTGVTSARMLSDPPHGVGSTGLHVVQGIGDWPWTVTEWDEQRIMGWEVTGGRFRGSHGSYGVNAEGASSRVTIDTRVKPSVLMRVLMLIMKRTLRRQAASDLEKLKEILEA
jgi:uncharacterized membrane protein